MNLRRVDLLFRAGRRGLRRGFQDLRLRGSLRRFYRRISGTRRAWNRLAGGNFSPGTQKTEKKKFPGGGGVREPDPRGGRVWAGGAGGEGGKSSGVGGRGRK